MGHQGNSPGHLGGHPSRSEARRSGRRGPRAKGRSRPPAPPCPARRPLPRPRRPGPAPRPRPCPARCTAAVPISTAGARGARNFTVTPTGDGVSGAGLSDGEPAGTGRPRGDTHSGSPADAGAGRSVLPSASAREARAVGPRRAPQARHPVEGRAAPGLPVCAEAHAARRPSPGPGGAARGGGVGVAGQGGEEHPLRAPVQVLHRALQMRAVGGQIVPGDGESAECGGDGAREEVLAAVDAHQGRQAADRPVRAVRLVAGDRGAQRCQDRVSRPGCAG